MESAKETASPGSCPKSVVPSQVARARMRTTPAIAVRCAASFSSATRRLPKGVAATRSRLPRRASVASVPESARIDHIPVRMGKKKPYLNIM